MHSTFANDITNCLKTLRNEGTVLYPTDTVWGLGCDATNEAAVQKIIRIKNRPANKSFVALINSIRQLKEYVSDVDDALINYIRHIKKPTTIIYNKVSGFAESVSAQDFSVAIRICKDDFCNELIQQYGKPILSTSANKSGEPSPRFFAEIDESIIHEVDYTVLYRRGDNSIAKPSAIVKFEHNEIKIIRE